ncbi:10664_t:CDS:2 [Funneliformis mosseae]|uniref:10664_t:CDS:1 n=1 Tax=Funneliformis mosseae TaxID=27381 RepID=A0A9N8VCR3_FUNMO|nr:10664_t:CDS:2 [Funneliformis mosseae]
MNDDEYSQRAESLSNVIDKQLYSINVEQYWNSVRIQNEQNTTRVNQIIMEEKKKQHKCLVDSNVITEHDISSNKLRSEFQKLENEFITPQRKRTNIDFDDEWNITLNSEYELKFREAIKKSKESRVCAMNWFHKELADNHLLNEKLGNIILKGLETLPSVKIRNEPSEITLITNYLDYIMKSTFHNPDKYIVQWPNIALNESKTRKFEGRSKQPDFTVSIIHQHQTESVIFVGEVSPPSQKNNVYKNCNDLIRIGVFMKDCMDFSIDKDYTIDFYMLDFKKGTYFMLHIGQIKVPASIKEMLSFVDELETLLTVREIFQKTYNALYTKLCNPGLPLTNAEYKRDTLETPKFRQLVNKTRDCHRICPFWYGRF